jgi:Periplasmic binding protein
VSKAFMKRTGRMPTDVQAGVGSAVGHYLRAIKALGSDDGLSVSKWMKENPVNDFFVTNGRIRADGRMMKDMYLAEVKTPAESKCVVLSGRLKISSELCLRAFSRKAFKDRRATCRRRSRPSRCTT